MKCAKCQRDRGGKWFSKAQKQKGDSRICKDCLKAQSASRSAAPAAGGSKPSAAPAPPAPPTNVEAPKPPMERVVESGPVPVITAAAAAAGAGPSEQAAATTTAGESKKPQIEVGFRHETSVSPYPRRPGFGKLGKKISLRVNFFPLKKTPSLDIYHYDVAITPEVKPKRLNRQIMESLKTTLEAQYNVKNVAFDGRANLYASQRLPLPGDCETFFSLRPADEVADEDAAAAAGAGSTPGAGSAEGEDGRRARGTFTVKLQLVAICPALELQHFFDGRLKALPGTVVTGLDVALRESLHKRYTTVSRSCFTSSHARDLGGGREVWLGFFQSLRPTQRGLMLNVDVAATAFIKAQSVLQFAADSLGCRLNALQRGVLPRPRWVMLRKALRGVRVKVTHIKSRPKTVGSLTVKPASQVTFPGRDGGPPVRLVDYFRETYGIRLRYPNLPCLHVGNLKKTVYLPMELCNVVEGQRVAGLLTPSQTAQMIRFTCDRPADRRRTIADHLQEAGHNSDPVAAAFDTHVTSSMAQVQARVLPPPKLQYGATKDMLPRGGQWNMRGLKLVAPSRLSSWVVLTFSLQPNAVENFVQGLVAQCKAQGMAVPMARPQILRVNQSNVGAVMAQALQSSGNKLQLFLCVLPTHDNTDIYREVKVQSDTVIGVPSQCVLDKHVRRCNAQYHANVVLKINTKLGGRNTRCKEPLPLVSDKPTLVIGADVTHPAPGESKPSIAAMVASIDANCIRFAASIRVQEHRQEIISDLQGMVRELLIAFYRNTRQKPHRIIFYRDGVSEGQFQQVLHTEMAALRAACASLEVGYTPPITFLVVQKRHHLRMFATSQRDEDRSGNVPAGTVIDTDVCHPTEFDFYLNSHGGLKGTNRPAHYHVLWDENGFSADRLQQLTNRLCYTYARCTRSVSIPPPAYYAHLLAFRARLYLTGRDSDCDSQSSRSSKRSSKNGAGGGRAPRSVDMSSHVMLPRMATTMFFV